MFVTLIIRPWPVQSKDIQHTGIHVFIGRTRAFRHKLTRTMPTPQTLVLALLCLWTELADVRRISVFGAWVVKVYMVALLLTWSFVFVVLALALGDDPNPEQKEV